jgi:hypothetical protein
VCARATAAIAVSFLCAAAAQAANQLFEGSWMVKAFGNERTGGTGESEFYSAFGMPQGINCNPNQPRCDFQSTPTDGAGNFDPLGGSLDHALYCAPWYDFGGMGTTMRPEEAGQTPVTGGKFNRPIPPLYRNPAFFTPNGKADRMSCTARTTDGLGGKGLVQAGNPVRGSFLAATNGAARGSFEFVTAPRGGSAGIRVTGEAGDFGPLYPYVYSYTYATLRNWKGAFGPGKGPGEFNVQYKQDGDVVASIVVRQGSAKFGGTMRMLGALHTKVCYYRNGGCSIGGTDWLYDVIGTSAYTNMGVVTKGYQALWSAVYFNTGLGTFSSLMIEGSRFPWTTGSVTVTAVGRGPHKTVHYAMGYDNRYTQMTANGATHLKGTIQLVSPTMTRWIYAGLPDRSWETAGIAILHIKFTPEPRAWAMLAAGLSALALAHRLRR